MKTQKYKIGDWIYYNDNLVWQGSNEIVKGLIYDIRNDENNPIIYIVKDNSTGIIFKLYPDEVIENPKPVISEQRKREIKAEYERTRPARMPHGKYDHNMMRDSVLAMQKMKRYGLL